MSTREQHTQTIPTFAVRNTEGRNGPQGLEEPTSDELGIPMWGVGFSYGDGFGWMWGVNEVERDRRWGLGDWQEMCWEDVQYPTAFSELHALLSDHDYMLGKTRAPAPSITSSFAANYVVGSPSMPEARQAQLSELTAQLSALGFQVSPIAASGPQAFYGVRPSNNNRNNNNNNRGNRNNFCGNNNNRGRGNGRQFDWASTQNTVYGTCNRCGIGHIPSQCPNRDPSTIRTRPSANFANTRAQSSNASANWHSDIGANSHVTPDLEAMDNSEAYYGDDALHVGNESPYVIPTTDYPSPSSPLSLISSPSSFSHLSPTSQTSPESSNGQPSPVSTTSIPTPPPPPITRQRPANLRNNKGTIDNIICQLGSAFALKDLGPLNYFLGIEIVPHVSDILLSQKKYILELLQSVGLSNCNPVSSPMVTSSSLSLDDSTAFSNPVKYQQVVGSLQYVTLSRPDIAFAVNKYLIRRSSGSALHAFTDVLWTGNPDTSLEAFSDADWAEAEYKALADTVAELTWLQALLNELGIRSSSTPIL
ncbi:nucleotide-binding alpha-beta plait domain-containing protein [Tanacetum coccineum]